MSGQRCLIKFTGSELYTMNLDSLWNGSIILPNNKTTNDLKDDSNIYILHATCDIGMTNGRLFIALPIDLKITDELDKLYNLFEHGGDYRNAIPVELDQASYEHDHLESDVNEHGDDCACCKY